MQSGFLKEVRFPITMLFVVLVVATAVALRRERLKVALTKVEGLTVAKLMLALPGEASPDKVGYHDPNKHGPDYPRTQEEQHEWWEKEAIRAEVIKAVPKVTAIEQSGQYIVAQDQYDPDKPLPPGTDTSWPWGFVYDVPMVGGGWLRIETRQPPDKKFRSELKEHEEQREGWWQKERLKPAAVGHRMYYVEALVSEPNEKRNPLAAQAVRLVFTNIEEKEDDDLNQFSVPGEIRAYYFLASSATWVGPMTKTEIEADILETCRAWGVTIPAHSEAYLSLRSMFERQETPLPLLSLSVASDSFLLWSFAIAIGLAAWSSFLLRTVQRRLPQAEDEPWILVEPLRQFRNITRWDLVPAFVELALFVGFHLVALAAPLLVGIIMIHSGSPDDRRLGFAMLVPAAVLCASLASKYFGIACNAWNAGERVNHGSGRIVSAQ